MSTDLYFLSIREAANLIESRDLSPVEITNAFLTRIEKLDPMLHVFVRLTAERALADARSAESEIMSGHYRGPLHGIPIGLKDIYATKGIPTTAQSRLLLDNVPEEDATTTRLLAEAGSVLLGKLTTHEFAIGGPSFDLPFPPARSPWNLEAFTGGSSSGSGAGLAAGMIMGAMGSDTGGSIRTPASFCGITGIKPTYGRVSRVGVVPLSYSLDTCGPMAWSAEDVAILLEVVAGYDPLDPASADVPVPRYADALRDDLAGLRIGVVRHFHETDLPVNREVGAALDAALTAMAGLGAEIEDVTLSNLEDYHACCMVILLAEAFAVHQRDLCARPDEYGEMSRIRIGMGAFIGAPDYVQALRRRRELCAEMTGVLSGVDALVTATTVGPAPPIEAVDKYSLFASPALTTPFNVAGNPVAAVRCGMSADGLPLSMQIAGSSFDEATVLRIAHAYEVATPWAAKRPNV